MEVQRNAQEVISLIDKTISRYEANQIRIKELEGYENDIRHEISLGKKRGVVEGYRLYEEQRKILLERYERRDENEVMHDLYLWCKANRKIKSEMSKIINSTNETETKLETRVYRPRYLNPSDLTMETTTEPEYELKVTKSYTKGTKKNIIATSERNFDKIEVNETNKTVSCYMKV